MFILASSFITCALHISYIPFETNTTAEMMVAIAVAAATPEAVGVVVVVLTVTAEVVTTVALRAKLAMLCATLFVIQNRMCVCACKRAQSMYYQNTSFSFVAFVK